MTGRTTAEIVVDRADAQAENMGLTSWQGNIVRKGDIIIAKNYFSADEIDTLNRQVTIFLETAELRVKERCDLTLDFWRGNVDKILAFHDKKILHGTGSITNEKMEEAIIASESQLVTVAMKRIRTEDKNDDMLRHILRPGVQLLPNTSGVRDAKEAVFAAQLSREAFETNWLKLEIHPDPRYLLPDPIETLKATEELAKMGFIVLPYCQADPVLCKRLEDAGAATVMPLGAPIGSNQGLQTREFLRIIIEQSNIPVVVDAGIGAPSHAAEAMEMGADAVLVNTAIAVANDPVEMAKAFKMAVEAGRMAYEAGLAGKNELAEASSPLTAFLD